MAETEQLSDLICKIYDTTLDAERWTDAMRSIAEFVGGSAAGLYSKNIARRIITSRYSWGLEPGFTREYQERYIKIDPVTFNQFAFAVGEVYSVSDCMPYDEFLQTRVYKEWAKPRHFVDHIATTLDKSLTSFAIFGVYRNEQQGQADARARRRMRLIVPHIRRAFLIGNIIDIRAHEVEQLTEALDRLSAGVFLVNASAKIVFANAAGGAILKEGKHFRNDRGSLSATDPQSDRALRHVFSAASAGDEAVGESGLALRLSAASDERWLAHVLPLTSGDRRSAGLPQSAVAAVFVRQASINVPSSLQTVTELYSLTHSETRVLGAIAEVGRISAIADILGISEATVKTHLQHLFEKTGVRRQSELIKLIAEHTSPVAN